MRGWIQGRPCLGTLTVADNVCRSDFFLEPLVRTLVVAIPAPTFGASSGHEAEAVAQRPHASSKHRGI